MINILFADDGSHHHVISSLSSVDVLNLSLAKNSKAVLETIKSNRPDLILLGNLNDGINRHTITRILKNDSDTASIIILFLEISNEDNELMVKASGNKPIKIPMDTLLVKETILNAVKNK